MYLCMLFYAVTNDQSGEQIDIDAVSSACRCRSRDGTTYLEHRKQLQVPELRAITSRQREMSSQTLHLIQE